MNEEAMDQMITTLRDFMSRNSKQRYQQIYGDYTSPTHSL